MINNEEKYAVSNSYRGSLLYMGLGDSENRRRWCGTKKKMVLENYWEDFGFNSGKLIYKDSHLPRRNV